MAMVPNTFTGIQGEINRLFDNMLGRFGEGYGETLSDWAPRVDIVEDNDSIRIYAELPGLRREDINVSVEQHSLLISGTRKRQENLEGKTWHRSERLYGTFKRAFNLPTTVDPNKVNADYRQGVLEISLPKAEHAKPRMIEVKVDEA